MRRIMISISVILLVSAMVPITCSDASSGPNMSTDYTVSDDSMIVSLYVSDNPGIFALAFFVNYDEDVLRMTDVKQGDALDSLDMTVSEGLRTHSMVEMDSAYPDKDNGIVVKIYFKILDLERYKDSSLVLEFGSDSAVITSGSSFTSIDLPNVNVIKVSSDNSGDNSLMIIAAAVIIVIALIVLAVVYRHRRH